MAGNYTEHYQLSQWQPQDRVLRTEGIRLVAEDVGGKVARTMLFDVASGQCCIRSYGKPELIF